MSKWVWNICPIHSTAGKVIEVCGQFVWGGGGTGGMSSQAVSETQPVWDMVELVLVHDMLVDVRWGIGLAGFLTAGLLCCFCTTGRYDAAVWISEEPVRNQRHLRRCITVVSLDEPLWWFSQGYDCRIEFPPLPTNDSAPYDTTYNNWS